MTSSPISMCHFETTVPPLVFHDDRSDFKMHTGSINVEFEYENTPMMLRCEFLGYGYDIRKNSQAYRHPSPPFVRLFLFHKQGGEYVTGGKRYPFVPNVLYLLPPNQSFEVFYHADSELLYSHLHICDNTMTPIFAGIKGLPSCADRELARRMRTYWRAGNMLQFQLATTEAVSRFAESHRETMKERHILTGKLGRLFEVIRMTEPGMLRVDALAENVGMSRAALSKSFSRTMGISLKQYITNIHLKMACELLQFSGQSIAQISEKLGLSDPHYFHRFFKKHMRTTPDAYRRSLDRMV